MKLAKADDVEIVGRAVTRYTEEIAEKLILAATDCPSMNMIATQCGVPYRTLRYWIQRGQEGDPRFEYFAVEFERARSGHEDRYMKQMEDIASQTDNPKTINAALKANMELLKKQFPKQWGDQLWVATMIEHKADQFDLSSLKTDQLREFMKMLKVIRASNDGAGEDEIERLRNKVKVGPDGDTSS